MASDFPVAEGSAHMLLPVLPMQDVCLFPEASLTVGIDRPAVLQAVEVAARTGGRLLAVAQVEATTGNPGAADLHPIGTIAELAEFTRPAEGEGLVSLDGLRRGQLVSVVGSTTLVAEVEPLEEGDADDEWGAAVEALARYLHAHSELRQFLDQQRRSQEPIAWVNLACQHLPITVSARQKLLAADAVERCAKISRGLDALLRKEQAT